MFVKSPDIIRIKAAVAAVDDTSRSVAEDAVVAEAAAPAAEAISKAEAPVIAQATV
jgi:hypothetical protein